MNSLLIGNFPLNLNIASGCQPSILVDLLRLLRPCVYLMSIDQNTLEGSSFSPSLNDTTTTLDRGLLQLSTGTHLVLDETNLTEGNLSERAARNIQSVIDLLDHQHISLDFKVQVVHLKTDYPLLSLSTGKSIFSVKLEINSLLRESTNSV